MNNEIKFAPSLVKRLNNAAADLSVAVAEAALAAAAQDKRVTVRTFATALRDAAPALGKSNAELAAAVKAAKADGATLEKVATAMAEAIERKRADDRRRAADKAAKAPAKALQKAQAKVVECQLAMRTPLQKAIDELTAADVAVKTAAEAWRTARAVRRDARAAYRAAVQAVEDESNKAAERSTPTTA